MNCDTTCIECESNTTFPPALITRKSRTGACARTWRGSRKDMSGPACLVRQPSMYLSGSFIHFGLVGRKARSTICGMERLPSPVPTLFSFRRSLSICRKERHNGYRRGKTPRQQAHAVSLDLRFLRSRRGHPASSLCV